ncbi:MAG: hypothetical protein H0X70_11785 [Segetibacter sp.]|nr:hypothetical protein [Segetibacter sp.]
MKNRRITKGEKIIRRMGVELVNSNNRDEISTPLKAEIVFIILMAKIFKMNEYFY